MPKKLSLNILEIYVNYCNNLHCESILYLQIIANKTFL